MSEPSNNASSIYTLVTSLCENLLSKRKLNTTSHVKKLRTFAYEILLGKKYIQCQDVEVFYEPECEVIAYEIDLALNYNLKERALEIESYLIALKNQLDTADFKKCIGFLGNLKEPPERDATAERRYIGSFPIFEESDFHFPNEFICANAKFNNDSFYFTSRPKTDQSNSCSGSVHATTSCSQPQSIAEEEESEPKQICNCPQFKVTEHYSWLTFGSAEVDHELPFLTEVGADLTNKAFNFSTKKNFTVINKKKFNRAVQYVLIGIPSQIFVSICDKIRLADNVTLDGMSHNAIANCCQDLIVCGTLYKALFEVTQPDYAGKYKNEGFIFTQLCHGVQNAILCYRILALQIPVEADLLRHCYRAKQLYPALNALAVICKVGPYAESTNMPVGVALLEHLYRNIAQVDFTSDTLVIFSIFHACLQVYFQRFLRSWMLDGVVVDPYNEFFIKPQMKYLMSRGRTYWTRSFLIAEDLVPEFLEGLQEDILRCGKLANLLKLILPNATIFTQLYELNPKLLECCVTQNQLTEQENNVTQFTLEVLSHNQFGEFRVKEMINRQKDLELAFQNVMTIKRKLTIKRLEIERLNEREKAVALKRKKWGLLKDELDSALEVKRSYDAHVLERDCLEEIRSKKIHELEQVTIKQEALRLVDHYENLLKSTEGRRNSIQKHLDSWSKVALESNSPEAVSSESKFDEINANNEEKIEIEIIENIEQIDNVPLMDEVDNKPPEVMDNFKDVENNVIDVIEANVTHTEGPVCLSEAQRNKLRVLSSEYGFTHQIFDATRTVAPPPKRKALTEAQRNKLKVMNEEMGFSYNRNEEGDKNVVAPPKELTEAQRNKLKIMNAEYGLFQHYSNVNVNANIINDVKVKVDMVVDDEYDDVFEQSALHDDEMVTCPEDLTCAKSDDETNNNSSSNIDIDDVASEAETSPPSLPSLFDKYLQQVPDFEFEKLPPGQKIKIPYIRDTELSRIVNDPTLANFLFFLQQSVKFTLQKQTFLLQNQLLQCYLIDLKFLEHLKTLRKYFFLLDGEFARNFTDTLFEKLYDVNSPDGLLNFRTLKKLLLDAMEFSGKYNEFSGNLSLKINKVPEHFDFSNVRVLNCLSLSYRVDWPLNILLPSDVMGKYDEVFKFLLEVRRTAWAMKKIFMDMKITLKLERKHREYLILSPQYKNVHRFRHTMTQFIQTFQNYIVCDVLNTSGTKFEENLCNVETLDQLFELHFNYMKDHLRMCFLNQKSKQIHKYLTNIFRIVLTFFNYLRFGAWEFNDDHFTHSNYEKLKTTFGQFVEYARYFYKLAQLIVTKSYRSQLAQLIDMLDINGYYSTN